MLPHRLEQQMQEQPQVLDSRTAPHWLPEQAVEPALEHREQLGDDLVLVAEVIVQIAWADLHLTGDVRGCYVRLAEAVEKQQGGFEDALSCPARALALRHESGPGWVKPAV